MKDPNAKALRTKAKDKMDKGKYVKAIKLFKKCLAIDSMSCDAWDELGICYRRSGQPDEAVKCYIRSLHINRENPVPAMNLGFLYLMKRDYLSAANAYTICLSIDSTNPEGYFGLASAAYGLAPDSMPERTYTYIGKAMERYQKNIARIPADVRLLAAKIAYHAGHYDVASTHIKMVDKFEIFYFDPSYAYYRGLLCLKASPPDKTEARRFFQMAKEKGYKLDPVVVLQAQD